MANLRAALRSWRRETAEDEFGGDVYKVFPNKTLEELVAKRPGTCAELLKVWGFKAARVVKYGPAVLAIIRDHPASALAPASAPPPTRYARSGKKWTTYDITLLVHEAGPKEQLVSRQNLRRMAALLKRGEYVCKQRLEERGYTCT